MNKDREGDFQGKEHKHWPAFIRERIETVDVIVFILLVASSYATFHFLGLQPLQTVAITIFIATVLGTLLFWRFRLAIALIGISALLITQTLSLEKALEFMNLDVIIFLASMMIIVEEMERVGLFKWLTVKLVKTTRFDPLKLMVVFMLLSAFTAAFIDEVTSILIMGVMILNVTDYLKLSPIPYIITAVLATNIGSSATVMGNPVGILVALRGGLTFEEYLRWATPVSVATLLALVLVCLFYYRGFLRAARLSLNDRIKANGLEDFGGWAKISDVRKLKGTLPILLATVALIVLSHRIELFAGMEKNTILVAAPLIGAGIVLMVERRQAREMVDHGVDWWTLLFFMFLFAKAGALEYTGVTELFARGIYTAAGGDGSLIFTFMIWGSALLSGTIDNVPIIAALIPTVFNLGELGINTYPLWWALLFGGTLGGNLTMVGSTANVVALGLLERSKNFYMGFIEWLKIGSVSVILTMALAHLLIFIQIPLML